jgi:hypothetical protein
MTSALCQRPALDFHSNAGVSRSNQKKKKRKKKTFSGSGASRFLAVCTTVQVISGKLQAGRENRRRHCRIARRVLGWGSSRTHPCRACIDRQGHVRRLTTRVQQVQQQLLAKAECKRPGLGLHHLRTD